MVQRKRKYSSLCLVLTLTLSPSASSLIVKGVQDEWPPYFHKDTMNKGKLHRQVDEIFCAAQMELAVEILPWNRAYKMAKSGEVDVILGAWKTSQREKDFYFSEPYYTNQIKLISLKSSPVQYQDLQQERTISIAVVSGYAYGRNINNKHVNFFQTKSANENIEFLLKNRVDAVLMDEEVFNWNIKQQSFDRNQFHVSEQAVDVLPLYLALSKNNALSKSIMANFNQALISNKPCKTAKP
ncbi:transporter substrate-binding domain-containing protein [Vibrio sp. OCN044]|uniref:Transporter substrate-binding domain-containing protein n=1 Tax=Vibrio tetraodonis subsp. pristinus TaxID=2695891 RepID=A0A6L8LXM1_9VIBR|nr:transporter substrate-binding domain-containing protein [Vibrio tetraodonis]MYM57952.1 transporter substrate-binding domain-containing protein [Vibrio tetraodonis subsp. pristinus]